MTDIQRGFVDELKLMLADQLVNLSAGDLLSVWIPRIAHLVEPPLRMYSAGANSRVVNVAAITNSDSTLQAKSIPPIGSILPAFTGGTVTVPAASGNNIALYSTKTAVTNNVALTLSPSNYVYLLVYVDVSGNLGGILGTAGTVLADLVAPPPVRSTFAIGLIAIHNTGGTIDYLVDTAITQFVGGGGGGAGSGDASELYERMRQELDGSPYTAASAIIFDQDESVYVDAASTGAFSMINRTFDFSGAGQTLVSKQMLDAKFLTDGKDVKTVDLNVFWKLASIDAAATYFIAQNGSSGTPNWQPITMSRDYDTDTYYGTLVLAQETSFDSLHTLAASGTPVALNITDQAMVAQEIPALTVTEVWRQVTLTFAVTGTPVGKYFVQIVRDSAGLPSLSSADVVAESLPQAMPSAGAVNISIPQTVLVPGTYHVVVRTDDTYKAAFPGGNYITLTGGASAANCEKYSASTGLWTNNDPVGLAYTTSGYNLDVRVKVVSTTGKSIAGVALLYDYQETGIVRGTMRRQVSSITGDTGVEAYVTTLSWLPDPNLLEVFWVEKGLIFKYPAFAMDGMSVTFPAGTFYDPPSTSCTLIFEQLKGNSFDNSDTNLNLLVANHLGSTDANLDKSATGSGILLRNAAGVLVEMALGSDNNWVVKATS